MKILYVVSRALEINTSASIRNIATIEGLIELGHSVDLITTFPDKKHNNYDDSIINKNINTTYIKLGGIQKVAKVSRKFNLLNPIKSKVYTFISQFNLYDNLKGIVNHLNDIEINDDSYDLIISSSDPKSSHLFVSKMFEQNLIQKTPWIQIWGDPFLTDITRNQKISSKKIKKEENKILKDATKIIYVSELTLKEQQKIYPELKKKMEYIPIPYIKKEIYKDIEEHKENFTFLYCGDYASNVRNITPIYNSIKSTNHKLIICGQSDLKLKDTDNIKIYSRLSFEKVKELEKECDILIHLSNLKGSQIPGKIYQYSGTNKPILFILDGEKEELKNTFEKYKRYIFVNNTEESIINKIDNIKNILDKENLKPLDEFSPSSISKKILSQIDSVKI